MCTTNQKCCPTLLIPPIPDHKFDLMYSKRAFVHWYVGEGMEEVSIDRPHIHGIETKD